MQKSIGSVTALIGLIYATTSNVSFEDWSEFPVRGVVKNYFFLNPAGQTGLDPVTFLLVFPLTQVIVFDDNFEAFAGFLAWTGAVASLPPPCESFTLRVGLEKVKPVADKWSHPPDSRTVVVAIFASPASPTTEIVALIGADEN